MDIQYNGLPGYYVVDREKNENLYGPDSPQGCEEWLREQGYKVTQRTVSGAPTVIYDIEPSAS
jgi:hypothetical protein